MLRQNDEFKIKSGNRGLPGKSFIYIVTLDYYLKMALSYLSNTPFLDNYITSFLKWKLMYNSREKMMSNFLNYMVTYDESRIEFLVPSRFFRRSDILVMLNKIAMGIKKYELIMEKKDKTNKDLKYLFKFELRFGKNTFGLRKAVPEIVSNILQLQETLVKYYLSFILSQLMRRRKGGRNPNELKFEAYQALLDMIDSYDSSRSKVPFHSFLKFFIKAEKHKSIKEENWGLKTGDMIELDDTKYVDPISLVERINISNSLEKNEHFIEMLSKYLPKKIYLLFSLKFGIINPLNPSEEIRMLF